MTDTSSLLSEADPNQLAAPHAYGMDGKPQKLDYFPFTRVHAPCNNLYTNIDDLSRLAMADLNRGELDGERIVFVGAYDELVDADRQNRLGGMVWPCLVRLWVGLVYR